jgi:hypothetical protein
VLKWQREDARQQLAAGIAFQYRLGRFVLAQELERLE